MTTKERFSHIVKGNFGLAFSQEINHASYTNGSNQNTNVSNLPLEVITMGGDGAGAFFSWIGIGSSLTAYDECPPLKAICNRRGLAYTNGKRTILNSVGKTSNSEQSKRVDKLLKIPNKYQSESAFKAQISVYLDLVGYVVIIPIKPVGFDFSYSESLWIVPPTFVSFGNNGNQLNLRTGGIDWVQIGGVKLNPDDVIIIQDINPSVNKLIIPSSNIKSLEHPINNIIGAYQSESNLIKHRGPTTLISSEINPQLGAPLPLLKDEKDTIQNHFNNSYGFLNGQSNTLITNASLKVQQVGFDAAQLRLHEGIKVYTNTICDTIGYPSELLSSTESKYDNMQQADLNLYTKFIIPRAKNIDEQLGYYLLGNNDNFFTDYSYLPELQANELETSRARYLLSQGLQIDYRNDMITKNQYLAALNLPDIGGEGDKYFSEVSHLLAASVQVLSENTNNSNNGNTTN